MTGARKKRGTQRRGKSLPGHTPETDYGRDGQPLDLHYARGRGNVTAYNANNDLITRLFEDGVIGMAEREAGHYLAKLWHRASVGSLATPELDRIPGQGQVSITAIQADTLSRLRDIHRELSKASLSVLFEVLARESGIKGIRALIRCPGEKGIERWVLRHALMELAEITGHASRK